LSRTDTHGGCNGFASDCAGSTGEMHMHMDMHGDPLQSPPPERAAANEYEAAS